MSFFRVTPGKIVRITTDISGNGTNFTNILNQDNIAPDIKLILAQPLTLNISSNFSSLFGSANTTGLNLLGGLSQVLTGKGFSGQKKEFGYQVWNNSEPISLNMDFQFYMGMGDEYSAQREVYNPIMALAKLPLPSEPETSDSTVKNVVSTLLAPGPNFFSIINSDKVQNKGRITSVSIGEYLRFPNVIVRRAEPTFSEEVDYDGYPIEGRISIEIVTVFNATQQMLGIPATRIEKD